MKKYRSSAPRPFNDPAPTSVPGGLDAAEVLACIQRVHRPVGLDDLLRFLDISRRDKKILQGFLESLHSQGKLVRLNGGKWVDGSHIQHIVGVLNVQRSGVGFVTPDRKPGTATPLRAHTAADRQRTAPAEIFIPAHSMGEAWHGDRVEVALQPPASKKTARNAKDPRKKSTNSREDRPVQPRNPEGRIVAVVERANKEITVLVSRNTTANRALCRPADPRLNVVFDVDTRKLDERPEAGMLLRVTLGEKRKDGLWEAVAFAALGHEDSVAVQEELVRINHGIPLEFPHHVEAEARLVSARAATDAPPDPRREDLRALPFVTIDGADAKDFDDAICVVPASVSAGQTSDQTSQATQGGWSLWVAIADVTHYVTPGSALDKEARERGNSYYFPSSVTPMLPEALSNDLCSLRPHEDRLVMAVRVDCTAHGQPISTHACSGIIRSQARLTYEQVQGAFDATDAQDSAKNASNRSGGSGGSGESGASPAAPVPAQLLAMLEQAKILALSLQAARTQRGSLDFDLPEAQFILNEHGQVINAVRRARLFSHRLIEECMLAANEAVARLLTEKGVPFPYRVHPEPDAERVAALFRMIRATGLANLPALPARSATNPESMTAEALTTILSALLAAARGTEQEFIVGRLVLRSLMQARYTPELAGHFGIASPCYCHFTSPIRRYADVLVHRALKHALGLATTPILAAQKLLAVCDQCNVRERVAQDAERETARRLGCLLLRDRAGETFSGIVSGVSDFGFFVELDSLPVEGLVRLTTLTHDWFSFDADRQELTGTGTGERYRLGDAVSVKLVDVHVGRLEINLSVLEAPKKRVVRSASVPRRKIRAPRRWL